MRYWAVVVPAERYQDERLFHHETLDLTGAAPDADPGPVPGDQVLLLAATEPPLVFGLGCVRGDAPLVLAYTRRSLDAPRPLGGFTPTGPVTAIDEPTYLAVAAQLPPPAHRRRWLVSIDAPIEAESPTEAVREFWTYVRRLGPEELPAFVAPVGDELAMRAYVMGEETNLDPEDDE